jgi:hypothetical protein
MSKQHTAVEYLQNEYKISGTLTDADFNIALAMEKEQSEKMYNHATLANLDTGHGQSFEEYYNETYKQKNQ